jgi:hypothetical protein
MRFIPGKVQSGVAETDADLFANRTLQRHIYLCNLVASFRRDQGKRYPESTANLP